MTDHTTRLIDLECAHRALLVRYVALEETFLALLPVINELAGTRCAAALTAAVASVNEQMDEGSEFSDEVRTELARFVCASSGDDKAGAIR